MASEPGETNNERSNRSHRRSGGRSRVPLDNIYDVTPPDGPEMVHVVTPPSKRAQKAAASHGHGRGALESDSVETRRKSSELEPADHSQQDTRTLPPREIPIPSTTMENRESLPSSSREGVASHQGPSYKVKRRFSAINEEPESPESPAKRPRPERPAHKRQAEDTGDSARLQKKARTSPAPHDPDGSDGSSSSSVAEARPQGLAAGENGSSDDEPERESIDRDESSELSDIEQNGDDEDGEEEHSQADQENKGQKDAQEEQAAEEEQDAQDDGSTEKEQNTEGDEGQDDTQDEEDDKKEDDEEEDGQEEEESERPENERPASRRTRRGNKNFEYGTKKTVEDEMREIERQARESTAPLGRMTRSTTRAPSVPPVQGSTTPSRAASEVNAPSADPAIMTRGASKNTKRPSTAPSQGTARSTARSIRSARQSGQAPRSQKTSANDKSKAASHGYRTRTGGQADHESQKEGYRPGTGKGSIALPSIESQEESAAEPQSEEDVEYVDAPEGLDSDPFDSEARQGEVYGEHQYQVRRGGGGVAPYARMASEVPTQPEASESTLTSGSGTRTQFIAQPRDRRRSRPQGNFTTVTAPQRQPRLALGPDELPQPREYYELAHTRPQSYEIRDEPVRRKPTVAPRPESQSNTHQAGETLDEQRMSTSAKVTPKAGVTTKKASKQQIAPDDHQKPYTILVCGDNRLGQLGLGDHIMEEQRPTINERLTAYEIVDFDCGANRCVALTKGGTVLTWGLGTEQNAALGTNWEPDAVRKIPNPVRLTHLTERYGNIVQVVATNDASFALTEQGYVLGWGCFKDLRLQAPHHDANHVKDRQIAHRPEKLKKLVNIENLAGGGQHILAAAKNGAMFALGFNHRGQLGVDPGSYRGSESFHDAVHVKSLDNLQPSKIACGENTSYLIGKLGKLYTWGDNSWGQLGRNTLGGVEYTPGLCIVRDTTGKEMNVQAVAGGAFHSLACDANGNLSLWGRCEAGAFVLPNSGVDSRTMQEPAENGPEAVMRPIKVHGCRKTTDVSAGSYHSIMIDGHGKACPFGHSHYYQTGQGSQNLDIFPQPKELQEGDIANFKVVRAAAGAKFTILCCKKK